MATRALKSIRDGLLSLAYPQQCRMCGERVRSWDDGVACHECWEDPKITTLFFDLHSCRKCGAPLQSAPEQQPGSHTGLCHECDGQPFEVARACGAYSGALEASILFLKSEPHLCPRLRDIIHRTCLLNQSLIESDLVVAVPLHRSRQRERGFNQATIIASLIASRFDLAFDGSSLARVAHTDRHRVGLDAIDRAKSVAGAFKVTQPKKVMGLTVLLIDDLFTTGSTISAAAVALREAGVARVRVLTIARALRANPPAL